MLKIDFTALGFTISVMGTSDQIERLAYIGLQDRSLWLQVSFHLECLFNVL